MCVLCVVVYCCVCVVMCCVGGGVGVQCVVRCVRGVCVGLCGVCVVQMIHNTASLSWRVRMMQLIRVAEHLAACQNTQRLLGTGNKRRSIFQSSASRCPKQNCRTIRSETSTTTRHRDGSTPQHIGAADNWAICRREARGHDSCSGDDGTTIQRDCERHHNGLRNWSCEHERSTVLPARDRVCQIHTHKTGMSTTLSMTRAPVVAHSGQKRKLARLAYQGHRQPRSRTATGD